jgi:hypothetical protein
MPSPHGMCTVKPPAVFASRDMVKVVFPSAYRWLNEDVASALGLDVCGLLWPDAVAAACPELRSTFTVGNSELVLRNPTLLPLQAAGLVVGITGALALLARRSRRLHPASTGAAGRGDASSCASWACAFAWFAAMNATSVMVTLMSYLLHSCLLLASCMRIPVCSYVCTNVLFASLHACTQTQLIVKRACVFFARAHTQAHSVYEPKTEAYEYWLSLDIMATGLSSGFRV